MNKVTNKIKQVWEENPVIVVAVGAAAVKAVAALMDANTRRQNAKTYEMEVQRRIMK